ncbi:Lysophospholipase, alpha-beta hydrolase superfamily [Micromonospora citrea]|uniref:Lysophospholipase, alpha-beta hydrolase superfamily n=1 Tax=Micromonospora citrea TaxID=47855 RepID=A0A1C6UWY9_9ACTN|nr:alpha/beta fold hydrolase [Micromonospora citrea]SCL58383.1 Lysophospholipase, alpha-beta hydrolase superfamily [Micromonospora citrea]
MHFTSQDLVVDHRSNLDANNGATIELFVRWFKPDLPPGRPRQPVLMVHGRSSPGLVSFDLRSDAGEGRYSWARELAEEGCDVFVMDLQGMGRSTRPVQMNDPCNINPLQQHLLLPREPCAARYAKQLTNSASDWAELGTVVNWILGQSGMPSKIDLIGYSAGAYAVGPYAMTIDPAKVASLLLLAPIFAVKGPSTPPPTLPVSTPCAVYGFPMHILHRTGFKKSWDSEVDVEPRYPGQRDDVHDIVDVVWDAFLDNDQLGRTWGPGVSRFRNGYWWGWNPERVTADRTNLGEEVPVLIVYGEKDTSANNTPLNFSVPELYRSVQGRRKLMYRLDGAGHLVVWERQRKRLHTLSRKWLRSARHPTRPYNVDGNTSGTFVVPWEGDPVEMDYTSGRTEQPVAVPLEPM